MLELDSLNKNIIKFIIILLCLLGGLYFVKIYQSPSKTNRIYKEALKDYKNSNYSNSYYLFSRISMLSKLKPIALYRQALCAKALGDKKSELKAYQALITRFPTNTLTPEAKYEAAQLLINSNPEQAKKYFNSVISSNNIDEDYKIASKYYVAKLERNKGEGDTNPYRDYLEKHPDGRLAQDVANTWNKYADNLTSKDYTLIAKAYYYAKSFEKADESLIKTETKDNWAIQALNAFALDDTAKGKIYTETGVAKYLDNIDKEDSKKAIDEYIKTDNPSINAINRLFAIANGNNKDYIWKLKCDNSKKTEKSACYSALYSNYPESEYAQDALAQLFMDKISKQQYESALTNGEEFLSKFPKSDYNPMIMFWVGKIKQKLTQTTDFIKYYQDIINNYPDSYYAYRSFWILKGINTATVNTNLDYKPVMYPYQYPIKTSIQRYLMNVQDYDMIAKLSKDEFIKSWVEYQKGNYAVSIHIAQKAMDKLDEKPLKTDLRWRLLYPQNYYKQVKNNTSQSTNNDALIMSIIKEESYFTSDAQSKAGAIGLMQLMPSTAHDIGQKYGINFNSIGLLNPELNIRIGNLYYLELRRMLNNQDISAIASYNGGIGAVMKWKNSLVYNDTDEFVEQIPYDETKNYVKKVFRSYWNYVRIYQQ